MRQLVIGDSRTAVVNLEERLRGIVTDARTYANRSADGGVGGGVREEVRDHETQLLPIADDGRRGCDLVLESEAPSTRVDLERSPTLLNEPSQLDLLLPNRQGPRVEPSEREQVLAERLHLEDDRASVVDGVAVLERRAVARGGHFQGGSQSRQRRPELVADVRGEALLASERLSQTIEELIHLRNYGCELLREIVERERLPEMGSVEAGDSDSQRARRA